MYWADHVVERKEIQCSSSSTKEGIQKQYKYPAITHSHWSLSGQSWDINLTTWKLEIDIFNSP